MAFSVSTLLILAAGLALCLGLGWARTRSKLGALRAALSAQQALIAQLSTRIESEELERRLGEQRAQAAVALQGALAAQAAAHGEALKLAAQSALAERDAALARVQHEENERLAGLRAVLDAQHEKLDRDIDSLQGMVRTIERWHDEMQVILLNNREIKKQNEEFGRIVKNVVMLALNAAIEAARAGEAGRGFAVVADGVKDQALTSEKWARSYKQNLDKNDLVTTTTFQDMQAGGNMIRTAVFGLKTTLGSIRAATAAVN